MMRTNEQPEPRYPVYKKSSPAGPGMADLVGQSEHQIQREQKNGVLHMREKQKLQFKEIAAKLGVSVTDAFWLYQKAKGRV